MPRGKPRTYDVDPEELEETTVVCNGNKLAISARMGVPYDILRQRLHTEQDVADAYRAGCARITVLPGRPLGAGKGQSKE